MSANPEIRTGWGRYFESLGFRTVRCVGPIAFAADRVNDLGEHVPHVTALASDAYDRSCFGPGAELPLR